MAVRTKKSITRNLSDEEMVAPRKKQKKVEALKASGNKEMEVVDVDGLLAVAIAQNAETSKTIETLTSLKSMEDKEWAEVEGVLTSVKNYEESVTEENSIKSSLDALKKLSAEKQSAYQDRLREKTAPVLEARSLGRITLAQYQEIVSKIKASMPSESGQQEIIALSQKAHEAGNTRRKSFGRMVYAIKNHGFALTRKVLPECEPFIDTAEKYFSPQEVQKRQEFFKNPVLDKAKVIIQKIKNKDKEYVKR